MEAVGQEGNVRSIQFLQVAYECAELTIPTLIMRNETNNYQSFVTPWQSVGAKGVTTLSSKLMLGLLPPSTTFFKLQLDDSKLGVEIPAEAKSELDLSFAKVERMIMDSIAGSTDRVQIFSALNVWNLIASTPESDAISINSYAFLTFPL